MVSLVTFAFQDWKVVGHSGASRWPEVLAQVGAWSLCALVLVLVVRALARRARYRAVLALGPEEARRVTEAVRAVERRTSGELRVVVLERADRHPGARWLAAVVFVLLGAALLGPWLPWETPALLLLSQAALGAFGYLVACGLPDFQRLFVSERRATEMAEEQALQEFARHGLHRTQEATGVLLFVSLLERRVVVLADEGIDARVEPSQWADTSAAVLDRVARGDLAGGLVAGVEEAGRVLAEHFPVGEGDRNELPDGLIVRRE